MTKEKERLKPFDNTPSSPDLVFKLQNLLVRMHILLHHGHYTSDKQKLFLQHTFIITNYYLGNWRINIQFLWGMPILLPKNLKIPYKS